MQEWIVAVIVACAAWAVAKRYLPARAKAACRTRAADAAQGLGWDRLAKKLRENKAKAASCADGCGTCGGCGTKDAPIKPATGISPDNLKRTARR